MPCEYLYSGYLDFCINWNPSIIGDCEVYVDNQKLQIFEHTDEIGQFTKYIEFTGQVLNSIKIISLSLLEARIQFSRFSTQPNPVGVSETVKNNYQNTYLLQEGVWGELIFQTFSPFYQTPMWRWYNPNNDVIEQKMEFWNYNLIQKNTAGNSITTWMGGVLSERASGYGNIHASERGNIIPILIHKNDIGKQNTIGELVTRQPGQTKTQRFYINLTII